MTLLFLSFNDFLIIGNQMPQSLEIFFVPYTKSLKNDFYKLFIFVFILSIHLEKKNTYESLTVTNVHRKCTHALFWNIKIKPTVNYIICLSLNFLPSCLHSDFFFLVSRIIFSVGTWYLPLNESTCVSSSMFCIFFWQQAQCWLYKGAPLTIEILSFDLLLCQRLANLWLHLLRSGVFFSCFPVTLARFSFSPLDSILQTGHNQYLHAISLQHQPGCFTGTLSVLFISRLGCDLFLYRTSTVSC